MPTDAKSGKEILALVLSHLNDKYYTVLEIFELLNLSGCFSAADLEKNESGEPKAYRRLNNALRTGAFNGTIVKDEDSSPFRYRVTP